MNHTATALTTLALAAGFAATAATAQGVEPIQAPAASLASPSATLSFPGTFGVPSAVAPKGGTGFVGLSYVNPRGGIAGNGGDASISAGYSIGNPVDSVSVTFGVSLTGTQPLGDAGSFSISASRLLQAGGNSATFIGASASNLAKWGAGSNDPNYSVYVSHLTGFGTGGVEVPVQLVAGYGTSNTRNTAGGLDNGAFAGIGVGMTQNLSGSISLTRTQVNTGFTLTVPNTSMSTSIGVLDVADNTNRRQLSVSVGFGF
jgi:hypothetical protein